MPPKLALGFIPVIPILHQSTNFFDRATDRVDERIIPFSFKMVPGRPGRGDAGVFLMYIEEHSDADGKSSAGMKIGIQPEDGWI
jgi:hypothetical protein